MTEWISVKDRLPPYSEKYPECENDWVILKYEYEKEDRTPDNMVKMFIGKRGGYGDPNEYESALGDGYVPSNIIITHWMRLPEPPK